MLVPIYHASMIPASFGLIQSFIYVCIFVRFCIFLHGLMCLANFKRFHTLSSDFKS